MDTPIADFLIRYADSGISRAHMPGHKGYAFPPLCNISPYDITEITGADVLTESDGIISCSEENAAYLYGAGYTCYSTSGSTLCIQTMLAAVCEEGDTLIAARNVHSAFVNSCALLGLNPFWVVPSGSDCLGISGEISAGQIEEALFACPQAKAVYITTPDYLGRISNIRRIAESCERAGVPLLVDNAHGAHLRFLPEDIHPISLGASMCCDSAHKTLPVLTGGAFLHCARNFPIPKDRVKSKMALFGTTSPSYLILMSLDQNNRYLAQNARIDFAALRQSADSLREFARNKGFSILSNPADFTRLTFDSYSVGKSGPELFEHFRSCQIECEYVCERYVVLMLSPQNTPEDFCRITAAISSLPEKNPITICESPFSLPQPVMSIRKAVLKKQSLCPVGESKGRIAAETKIKCPPGVPVVVPGELIGEKERELLKKSGISTISVIE